MMSRSRFIIWLHPHRRTAYASRRDAAVTDEGLMLEYFKGSMKKLLKKIKQPIRILFKDNCSCFGFFSSIWGKQFLCKCTSPLKLFRRLGFPMAWYRVHYCFHLICFPLAGIFDILYNFYTYDKQLYSSFTPHQVKKLKLVSDPFAIWFNFSQAVQCSQQVSIFYFFTQS